MFHRAAQSIKRGVIRTVVSTGVVVGTLEITTHLPSQGRSSELYHSIADDWITPLMRRYLDPEVAHDIALALAQYNLTPTYHPSAIEQSVTVQQTVWGRTFSNPVGLAAGFDKDGVIIQEMLDLGFGFVEIGTVTVEPQSGNPKPRMFRLPHDLGIINRYGFNSAGAAAVERNLQTFRSQQQQAQELQRQSSLWNRFIHSSRPSLPGLVGINIGRNKDSDDHVEDYVSNIRRLGPYADYLVLNISSPNTVGLRELQEGASLRQLLTACLAARDQLAVGSKDSNTKVPLLIKVAPDLTDEQIEEIAKICMELQVDGLVVTNTTNQRPVHLISAEKHEIGGLSGAPVRDLSTECIRKFYRATSGQIPIIGVGGVGSGAAAYEKFKAGASLIQVYSMMVYHGPGVVSKIRHELAEEMNADGQRSIHEVIGMDHEDLYWKNRMNKQRLVFLQQEQQAQQTDISDEVEEE